MTPVVLVVGAPLAGVSGVVAALRTRLPEVEIVDDDVVDRAPDAVLAVVSAVAPMTRSEWARVERVLRGTSAVIGVVAKIDAHRQWREVVAVDRDRAQRWGAGPMPWVGVAAAPDLGDAAVDDLVAVLRDRLANPGPVRRPRRPQTAEPRYALAHTRIRLVRGVRERTSVLRAELRAAALEVTAGGAAAFERDVQERARQFDDELDAEIAQTLGVDHPRARLDLIDVPRSASSRRLEGRLTAVLGLGFGLGVALALSRLVAGLAPGLVVAGAVMGTATGLTLVVWVVRARRLLHDRALLDRWVTDVAATLRWHGEAMVAERFLGAQSARVTTHSRSGVEPELDGSLDGGEASPRQTQKDVTDQYEW